MGNIIEIFENGRSACRYEYDALGRLTREDNVAFGKTTTWGYDNNGNILARYEYAITTKPTSELHLLNATCKLYTYDDNSDQLVSYNGETFVYDDIGNPTTYRGKAATWEYGRLLTTYNGNTFSYDARGRRISKNSITFTYDFNGNLIKQSNGLEFLYDHTGVFAVKYSGSTYFYRKNAQNDIISLLDSNGAVVVKYKYDAWGKCVVDATTTNTALANLNPFRYRSYYFDTETNLYFLKTRYYDPELGRFITIDDISYLDPDSINGLNLYAYCGNNPVTRIDPLGRDWWNPFTWDWASIGKIVAGIAIVAGLAVGSVFTGGMLSVVLAGAAIGASAGFLGGGISGLATGGGLVGFANGAFAGAITGAISGAIATSPLGIGWQMSINAAIGAGNYFINQSLSGANPTLGGLIAGALTGTLMGWVGGNGWLHGTIGQLFKQDILLNLSKNFIANAFGYLGKKFLTNFTIATASTGFAGGFYGYLENTFLNKEGNFFGF